MDKLKRIDEEIYKCNLCSEMVEKFPNSKTVSIGKSHDIVILGEAPANNGLIDLTIEDTYFLEAIKCYPIDRKFLNKCGDNCKKFLFLQLEVIKPKVILSLGDSATKTILDFKYKKFSDVVGKVFDVNGFKVIPIDDTTFLLLPKSQKCKNFNKKFLSG